MAWHRLGEMDALREVGGTEFTLDGKVIAVFKIGERLFAVDGMCAHQGGPIAQGQLDGTCVTCPWHGWQYDVTNGCHLLTGKSMLDVFPIEQRDREIWIEL